MVPPPPRVFAVAPPPQGFAAAPSLSADELCSGGGGLVLTPGGGAWLEPELRHLLPRVLP